MLDKIESRSENSETMGRIGDRPYWVYSGSLLVRALHQIGAAVFLAAYLLDAVPGPPLLYVAIAFVSGLMLSIIEWMRHRQIYREVSGVTTLVKLLLLGAAFHGYLPPQGTVLLAFFIASLAAHAPKRVRHKLLF
jgi:hypothetical protein